MFIFALPLIRYGLALDEISVTLGGRIFVAAAGDQIANYSVPVKEQTLRKLSFLIQLPDSLTAAVTPGNTSDRPEHPEAATELYEWNRTSSTGSRNCQKGVRLSVYEAPEALSPNLQMKVCQRHLSPWTPPFRTLKRRTKEKLVKENDLKLG
ncbi:hypothetical protein WN944_000193 [Citrus x changshan-huyou]|uniref:Uncharacterized protein n=1 Tax=Citrus x changshan-huyou TaxID=2935761 RepID=A0AAP0MIQ3_9ROSI